MLYCYNVQFFAVLLCSCNYCSWDSLQTLTQSADNVTQNSLSFESQFSWKKFATRKLKTIFNLLLWTTKIYFSSWVISILGFAWDRMVIMLKIRAKNLIMPIGVSHWPSPLALDHKIYCNLVNTLNIIPLFQIMSHRLNVEIRHFRILYYGNSSACVALRVRMYLAPRGADEWGFRHPRPSR